MTDEAVRQRVILEISKLMREDRDVIIVHGGGPFIKEALEMGGIESTFIDGHRQTSPEALRLIEMALKGRVNGELVRGLNAEGVKAIGLSGKDGHFVKAVKRMHEAVENGSHKIYDLGQVGDVDEVDPTLPCLLLAAGYMPVITCIASDDEGNDYNINADMFAGHIAGALNADHFLVLTDVDGLYLDKHDPESLLEEVSEEKAGELSKEGVIAGGMIPKIESCFIALKGGVKEARIINGMKPEQISAAVKKENIGTRILVS